MINAVNTAVDEMLLGTVISNPGLVKMENHRVVLRRDLADVLPDKVGIICGGGSGHEPAFAGYVGDGMLHASIAGSVFASPPSTSTLAAILALAEHKPSGILVVVFNYTGDRVNFGLAVERAKVLTSIPIEIVTVGEDTALLSADRTAGRRGLAGGVLFLKIVGAMAKSGMSLADIVKTAEADILPNLGTIGVCLRPCIVPGNDSASFSLADNEMEVGLGVHGEAGILRTDLKSAQETVKIMLERMTSLQSETRLSLEKGDKVVLLINNLGAISDLEMGILIKESVEQLSDENYSVSVERIFAGRFMTSLEMSGFSISLLKLSSDSILQFVDTATQALGWSPNSFTRIIGKVTTVQDPLTLEKYIRQKRLGPEAGPEFQAALRRAVDSVCDSVMDNEAKLNLMDTGSGDADCGSTLSRGAKKLKSILEENGDSLVRHPTSLLRSIAQVSESEMGGSSGGMFSIFFEASASKLETESDVDIKSVSQALWAGLEAVQKHGRARVGDRTLIDALQPGLQSLKDSIASQQDLDKVLESAATAAENGAQSTTNMKASAGRASYVPQSELKHPDPGAFAVALIFQAVLQSIKK